MVEKLMSVLAFVVGSMLIYSEIISWLFHVYLEMYAIIYTNPPGSNHLKVIDHWLRI